MEIVLKSFELIFSFDKDLYEIIFLSLKISSLALLVSIVIGTPLSAFLAVSEFHGKEDTILYSSCFDANGGLFETILSKEDAVFSDELNHASIIDGIRLCKAEKNRYRHADTPPHI